VDYGTEVRRCCSEGDKVTVIRWICSEELIGIAVLISYNEEYTGIVGSRSSNEGARIQK
jgi:hypothetical protein